MNEINPLELLDKKFELLGSLLLFTKVFYKLRTGRDFGISHPVDRESHHITICKELKKVFKLETNRLLINIHPGSGKSEMLIHFVAWAMAHYPDSQFIYISYSHELAVKHTYTIKQIMSLPQYKYLFGVEIKHDSSAKDNFQTTAGGSIKAFGSGGAITGQDAGLPHLDRFSGGVIIDDIHKPEEVHSDSIRESVKRNYFETILPRPRAPNVPIIFIGQRLREDDLADTIINGGDGYDWRTVILEARDEQGNILYPAVTSQEMLDRMEKYNPYVYSAQYQQRPTPAGGGIFKKDWFVLLDEEPRFVSTFITADSSETAKSYNDATVFSFWGVYRIEDMGQDVDLLGVHLIDCLETRVEPADLEPLFMQFYVRCMEHRVKPMLAGIEKKSTGVTLASVLKKRRGLQIVEIQRTRMSGSKATRYLEIQPFVSSGRLSLLSDGHLWDMTTRGRENMFIEHMIKITANDTHRFDDIADTCYDAIKMALIDKIVTNIAVGSSEQSAIVRQLAKKNSNIIRLQAKSYGTYH